MIQQLYDKYETIFIMLLRCKRAYRLIQMATAYHSTQIEGNNLTFPKMGDLYGEGELVAYQDEMLSAKDIQEVINHFLTFDHMLWTLEKSLSEDLIKEFHYRLRLNLYDDIKSGFLGGEYRKESADEVSKQLNDLLLRYRPVRRHSLEEIVQFHVEFMRINLFPIASGLVGRLLMLRESIASEIPLFLIRDKEKYTEALEEAMQRQNIEPLIAYIKSEQTDHGIAMFDLFFEEYTEVYNSVRMLEYEDYLVEYERGQRIALKNLKKAVEMAKSGHSPEEIATCMEEMEEYLVVQLLAYVDKYLKEMENGNGEE